MLIDANIFLELFLDQDKADLCEKFINKIFSGEISATISTFTIDTIIINLERKKTSQKIIQSFLTGLSHSTGLRIYQPNVKDRTLSLNLIQKYNLDYEDALTLQSAISSGCKEILSFDKHFDKVKEIKRVEP